MIKIFAATRLAELALPKAQPTNMRYSDYQHIMLKEARKDINSKKDIPRPTRQRMMQQLDDQQELLDLVSKKAPKHPMQRPK